MTFSHVDEHGKLSMVDVGDKNVTRRVAVAGGRITFSDAVYNAIALNTVAKGNVLNTAEVAGILAAKKVPDLIPLCHQVPLSKVSVDFDLQKSYIDITATAICVAQTGVEMEALQAVSTALLTIYDMCKAIDKTMVISDIRLLSKTGGKSGEYTRAT